MVDHSFSTFNQPFVRFPPAAPSASPGAFPFPFGFGIFDSDPSRILQLLHHQNVLAEEALR